MLVDTLYTSPTYNSFIDVDGMTSVMAELSGTLKTSFWNTLTQSIKEALVVSASREASKLDWQGVKNASIIVRTLNWPREDMPYVGSTEIPYELKLYLGCWVVHNAVASPTAALKGAVASKTVGSVAVSYNTGGAGDIRSSSVCEGYISDFLIPPSSIGGIGTIGTHRGL